MNILTLFFGFSSRINRAKYWLWILVAFVFFTIVVGLAAISNDLSVVIGVGLVAYIPIIVSAIAVGSKRLHDRDKSAWWLLVFFAAPLAMPFTVPVLGEIIPPVVAVAALLWGLIELGAIRGTIGVNQYGPDPVTPA